MVDVTQSLSAQPVSPERAPRIPVFQLFGVTFRTFGQGIVPFLILSVGALLPAIVRLVFFPPTNPKFSWTMLTFTLIHMAVAYFFQVPMTFIATRLMDGQPYTFGQAMSLAARRGLPVVIVAFLAVIATYVGLILLIVPGLIVATMLAVVIPVASLEGLGPIASMKRSMALTQYNRWRVLGVFVLFFLPFTIVTMVISMLFTMRGQIVNGQWASEAIQLVWLPLAAIFSAAIYVALRRLKENAGVAAVFD